MFHNSPFDVPVLVGDGLMGPQAVWKVWDTIVGARMASPSEIGGAGLAAAYQRHLPDDGLAEDKASLYERWRKATGKSKAVMFRELDMTSEAYLPVRGA